MKLADFRNLSRNSKTTAVIISDGCRDYVIEVHHERGVGVLKDRRGRPARFRSIAQARHVADYADEIRLSVRVAADEACAGSTVGQASFASQVLYRKSA